MSRAGPGRAGPSRAEPTNARSNALKQRSDTKHTARAFAPSFPLWKPSPLRQALGGSVAHVHSQQENEQRAAAASDKSHVDLFLLSDSVHFVSHTLYVNQ